MEKILEHTSLSEQIETGLQGKVNFAKLHCLTLDEREEIKNKIMKTLAIQKERELTDEEVEHYYPFFERLDQASVIVSTLPEARRVMEIIGLGKDSLIDTLSHENAHANKAMQLGANFGGYKFTLIKDVDGGYLVLPTAVISVPEEWDSKKREEVDTQVTMAPDEYGNKMSESDKEQLRIKYGK